MRICLATVHTTAAFIPLALLYLKAYLVHRTGVEPDDIAIREFPRNADPDHVADTILADNPDVVGLSCYVWNITTFREVVRQIKRARPSVRIVLGGPEVGPLARRLLQSMPDVNVIVKSEGEIPFSEIITRWRRGEDVDDVNGICFRQGEEILETMDAPPLMDLNHLPSPHLGSSAENTARTICIETQRGCVFRCNFCFYNKDLSIRNRRFDLERVKSEIAFWLQKDVAEIYLMDPVFNLNAARAKEICRFIIEHNERRIPFHAEVWAEFFDRELASLMRDANFQFLEVGLQTTDEATLAAAERRLKLQKFIDGVGYLKEAGLHYELQLIHGLPGETRASFSRSLNFAISLDPPDLAVFPLMVLPGTELWRKAEAFGLAFDPSPPYLVRSHQSMDRAEIEYGRKLADAAHALSRSRALRLLAREPNVSFSDMVDKWIGGSAESAVPPLDGAHVLPFIEAICAVKEIPSAFYRGFASLEFADAKHQTH